MDGQTSSTEAHPDVFAEEARRCLVLAELLEQALSEEELVDVVAFVLDCSV
jgi:hypothetical protein